MFKVTFAALLLPFAISAADISTDWIGLFDTSYSNAGNWTNGVPINSGPTQYAAHIFITVNNPVQLATSATINHLDLGPGNGLTVGSSNSFTVNNQTILNPGANLQLGPATTGSLGNLINFGTVNSAGTLAFAPGSLNAGTILMQGGAQLALTTLANFNGSTPGSIVADASTLTVNPGGVVVGGAITGQNGAALNFNNTFVDGTVNVHTASVLTLNNATLADLNIGAAGSMTLAANTTNNLINNSMNNAGQIAVNSGAMLLLNVGGTYANNGTINASNSGALVLIDPSLLGTQTTIGGTGTIQLHGGAILSGGNLVLGPGQTVQGQGSIQGLTVINQGTIQSSDPGGLFIFPGVFTNTGTIVADTLVGIGPGTFTNYANNTLTGGTYDVTGILAISSADIHTNQASIALHDGGLISGNGDALANFNLNDTGASFTITGNHVFQAPAGGFTNNGAVTVGTGTLFLMQAGDTYTQNSGSTEVNGQLLQAGNVVLNGGTLSGTGQIFGNVQNNGATVAPGDAPGPLTIFGSYMQSATSEVDIEFATMTEYGQLNILSASNSVIQGGTLRFIADPGFSAPLGQIFWILNAPGGLSGGFDSFTTNYFAGSEMFEEVVGPNMIGALVVPAPEPGMFVVMGLVLAAGSVTARFRFIFGHRSLTVAARKCVYVPRAPSKR